MQNWHKIKACIKNGCFISPVTCVFIFFNFILLEETSPIQSILHGVPLCDLLLSFLWAIAVAEVPSSPLVNYKTHYHLILMAHFSLNYWYQIWSNYNSNIQHHVTCGNHVLWCGMNQTKFNITYLLNNLPFQHFLIQFPH